MIIASALAGVVGRPLPGQFGRKGQAAMRNIAQLRLAEIARRRAADLDLGDELGVPGPGPQLPVGLRRTRSGRSVAAARATSEVPATAAVKASKSDSMVAFRYTSQISIPSSRHLARMSSLLRPLLVMNMAMSPTTLEEGVTLMMFPNSSLAAR